MKVDPGESPSQARRSCASLSDLHRHVIEEEHNLMTELVPKPATRSWILVWEISAPSARVRQPAPPTSVVPIHSKSLFKYKFTFDSLVQQRPGSAPIGRGMTLSTQIHTG